MTQIETETIINLIEDKIQELENFDCDYSVVEYIINLQNIIDKLKERIK